MKLLAFAIFDEKSATYGNPFFTNAVGVASRNLQEAVHNRETMISRYPEDFALYHLGYFDNESGHMDASQPELVVRASSFLIPKEADLAQTKNPRNG